MIKIISLILLTAMSIMALFSGAPMFLLPLPIFAGCLILAMSFTQNTPPDDTDAQNE